MKKRSLWRNLIIYCCIMIAVLVIGTIFSMQKYQNYKEYAFHNNARILATDQLEKISKGFASGNFDISDYQEGAYPVVITDVNGMVLYSDKNEYRNSERVKLSEFLQVDQSLFLNDSGTVKTAFAIEAKERTVGFVAFYIPRSEAVGMKEGQVIRNIFMPIMAAIGLVLMLSVFLLWYMKRRVIAPVEEMIDSSKAIIEGDYTISVIKTRSGKLMGNDIEKLSYNFELMRDELGEKRAREEELNRSQKELISCISHDLKTPISTIKAYGEGLRDGMAKEPEKINKYAEIIVNKAEVLTKMISDLLEYSNAELNQLSIIKKEQYFNEYMDSISKELQGLVNYKGMEFGYDNTAPNLLVNFDKNRITQVMANLVDNSIKYRRNDNGKIEISVNYLEVQKQIVIKVCDNGNGIGPIDIPFVFGKFYRSEKSRSLSIPGSGLGLSICKYIIEEHGGEILCESSREAGTAFVVSLPV